MTEQEFINVGDITHIHNAVQSLSDICIANQPCIDADEFSLVILQLRRWQIKIRNSFEIENPDDEPRCHSCKDAVATKQTWATVKHSDGTDQRFAVRTCDDCDPDHAMLEAMPPVR